MTAHEARSLGALRSLLATLPRGRVSDVSALERVLVAAWDHLEGTSEGGMEARKILDRLEKPAWRPPELRFVVERHGATVLGSTRAELQHWVVDVDKGVAWLEARGVRQVESRDSPLDVEPIATDIASAIVGSADAGDLRWSGDRHEVRILLREIPGLNHGFKETLAGRRGRFRFALRTLLEPAGWREIRVSCSCSGCAKQGWPGDHPGSGAPAGGIRPPLARGNAAPERGGRVKGGSAEGACCTAQKLGEEHRDALASCCEPSDGHLGLVVAHGR